MITSIVITLLITVEVKDPLKQGLKPVKESELNHLLEG